MEEKMKRALQNFGVFIVYFMLMTLMLSTTAYAYIDPAATSYYCTDRCRRRHSERCCGRRFLERIKLFFRNKKMQNLEKSLAKKADK